MIAIASIKGDLKAASMRGAQFVEQLCTGYGQYAIGKLFIVDSARENHRAYHRRNGSQHLILFCARCTCWQFLRKARSCPFDNPREGATHFLSLAWHVS